MTESCDIGIFIIRILDARYIMLLYMYILYTIALCVKYLNFRIQAKI